MQPNLIGLNEVGSAVFMCVYHGTNDLHNASVFVFLERNETDTRQPAAFPELQ